MSTVLIVGGGGREHALAWKMSQSPKVKHIIVAPGNDGFPTAWERVPFSSHPKDFVSLARIAKAKNVDLAVIGPDNPLADGIVDVLESSGGILTFGPKKKAAQIEASKAWAKDVMQKANVPTARFWIFDVLQEAEKFLNSRFRKTQHLVIKADGLAFGKGVRICQTLQEGLQAAKDLFPISKKLVIEEFLEGEEISWMAFCDGTRASLLEPARDYKRLLDGNLGLNTGGMGSFSPVSGTQELSTRVLNDVFLPTLKELEKRGCPFRGLLYAGLMFQPETKKFWVLEFNSRFGDPETQVLLPRMEGDLFSLCMACAKGDLSSMPALVPFSKTYAVYVVACAPGYPAKPEHGLRISGMNEYVQSPVFPRYFFSGVQKQNNNSTFVTHGGRVFGALGTGNSLVQARQQAYDFLTKLKFHKMHFRKDIGE
ncbi:MAG: phosphoribosylamine--glycine ligase [Deltaproteobacteria bacterium]|nr:phosphoribosylamine--glycine ligase [Deltaproteobacteria bacterium]